MTETVSDEETECVCDDIEHAYIGCACSCPDCNPESGHFNLVLLDDGGTGWTAHLIGPYESGDEAVEGTDRAFAFAKTKGGTEETTDYFVFSDVPITDPTDLPASAQAQPKNGGTDRRSHSRRPGRTSTPTPSAPTALPPLSSTTSYPRPSIRISPVLGRSRSRLPTERGRPVSEGWNDMDIVVGNPPGAVRFDYEHECGDQPAYSVWLWGDDSMTHYRPDGTAADGCSVIPEDLLTATCLASSWGRVVSYSPVALEDLQLRHNHEVEHVLFQLAGSVHEPLRHRGGDTWHVISESWVGVENILKIPWMAEHGARELPDFRYTIEFRWPELTLTPSAPDAS